MVQNYEKYNDKNAPSKDCLGSPYIQAKLMGARDSMLADLIQEPPKPDDPPAEEPPAADGKPPENKPPPRQ